MLIKLTGGKVYDPANKVSGQVRDIYVENGKIVVAKPNARADATYDVNGRLFIAAAITPPAPGSRAAEMGSPACFEPAMLPANARQAHMEMGDTPMVDKGAFVMLGSDDFFLRQLAGKQDLSQIKIYLSLT